MSPMRRFLSFRDFDWALLGMVLLLCTISVLEIYSATLHTRSSASTPSRSTGSLGGLVAMFIFAKIDYHRLIDWAPWAYGVCLVALVAVQAGRAQGAGRAALDQDRADALSAIGVGQAGADPGGGPLLCQPRRTQPDLEGHLQGLRPGRRSHDAGAHSARPGHHAHLCADPGCRAVSGRNQLAPGTDSDHCGPGSGGRRLDQRQDPEAYQKARLTSFINPDNDPKGAGYQIRQSHDRRRLRRHLGQGRGQRAPRPRATFCPFPTPTSSLPPSARSTASWARFLCCCYTSSY